MLTASEVIDTYYLDTRCMLIEIAATLDRHDRAGPGPGPGPGEPDERLEKLRAALEILAERDAQPDRARRLLLLFSDPVE